MRFRDWALVLTCLFALAAGLLFPEPTALFIPFPPWCMMGILFLNFLDVRPQDVARSVGVRKTATLAFLGFKMVLVPALAYLLFRLLLPEYALAALLLGGMSCGVAGPVFSAMFAVDAAFATALVFLTSILVPFTLPFLVKLLHGFTLSVSLSGMILFLSQMVLVPLALSGAVRKGLPALVSPIRQVRFPLVLLFFCITNMGVFSRYSAVILASPEQIATTASVTLVLAALFFFLPLFLFRKERDTALNGAIGCGIMNNILALIFAADQLGATEALTAALYTIPYFALLPILRTAANRLLPST